MEDLSSIEDASHELVMGQMSYMFVPDKALALRETMRVLKPGGLLIANVWNSFDLVTLAGGMMQAVTGGPAGPPGGAPPPPNPNGPMSLAEPELFDALLRDAGFDLSAKSHNHVAPLTAPLGKLGDEQAFKVRTPLCRREKARAEGRRRSLGTPLDFPLWQLAREREHPTPLSPLSLYHSLLLSRFVPLTPHHRPPAQMAALPVWDVLAEFEEKGTVPDAWAKAQAAWPSLAARYAEEDGTITLKGEYRIAVAMKPEQ
jgi:hypothetical protein